MVEILAVSLSRPCEVVSNRLHLAAVDGLVISIVVVKKEDGPLSGCSHIR